MEFRRVLVTTDLSESARPALVRGVDLARQFKADLHVLNVVPMADSVPAYPLFDLTSDTSKLFEELTEASRQRLQAEVASLSVDRDEITVVLRHAASPAPAILEYAEELDVDLIVMGTHGFRGVRRFLLGSVAEEVVRKANCSVITCSPKVDPQPMQLRRVLAAVDLSSTSDAVVSAALDLAQRFSCGIDWLHVVPEPSLPAYASPVGVMSLYNDPGKVRTEAHKLVERLIAEHGGQKIDHEIYIEFGTPDREIVHFSEEKPIDLIVISSKGLTGLPYVLLGSTADRVVRRARCCVLTLREPEED